MSGWIGVDLDGTLAVYDEWRGEEHIGEPVAPMVARVKAWLDNGEDVRIFTARVDGSNSERCREVIEAWCLEHIGRVLPVTNRKDYGMVVLWDDRAMQVETNTGLVLQEVLDELFARGESL